MFKAIYVLRISFPISCLHLYLHLAGSFLLPSPPGPSRKHTLSTLQCKHLLNELIPVCSELTLNRTAPKEPSTNLDPECLFPWRPDQTYLLENHPLRS
ncbi:hypothetical protein AMECASPLE_014055 [Ameca splendens]|uniref:Secreted protein n=1 Tax=Ameca splendens TaxID=208324 RepID=A0ABV0Z0C7_9TELE